MVKITKRDILHLARLSKVSLGDKEAESLQKDLDAILGYIEQLKTLDTTDVEPTYQVGGLKNVWREDRLEEKQLSTEHLLALAPSVHDEQIKVPKVL